MRSKKRIQCEDMFDDEVEEDEPRSIEEAAGQQRMDNERKTVESSTV